MSIRWFAFWMIVLSTAISARAEEPAKTSDAPSLEFTLEIDGRSIDLVAGEKTTVEIGGKKLPIKLVAKPDRLFKADGISFRILREFNYAVDRETPAVAIHSFSGDHTVLMVQQLTVPLDTDRFRKQLVDVLVRQFGENNTKVEPVNITLGGKEFIGSRILVAIAGQSLRQDIYAFTAGGMTTCLMIQLSNPKTDPGDETKATIDLLDRTLEIKP